MAEGKMTEEIRADMLIRGWKIETIRNGENGWECEIYGPGVDMDNGLLLSPMVSWEGNTEKEAIQETYAIALISLPSKILGGTQ